MMIQRNLTEIQQEIPSGVTLVIVSKTQPVETIRRVYDMGQRNFGENKVKELLMKHPLLPQDIHWHFIGHLQRNKVKLIVPVVEIIHSIDSLRLLAEVNNQAARINRIVNCLLQFHIAMEETKFGLDPGEAHDLLSSPEYQNMKNIRICGVMGMATFTSDKELVIREFRRLASLFKDIKQAFFADEDAFREISMGMTSDFREAIHEGSTIVRIGTAIFGERHQ